MPPSPYNKPITKFNQMKKKKDRVAKKALGIAKIHSKVRVDLVSGTRTKKHQRKADHKEKCLKLGSAKDKAQLLLGAPPAAVAADEIMLDVAKAASKSKAKLRKKATKANKMVE